MIGWLAIIIGGYFVGAIPFGVLIGRARGVNIREHGSKNIGATNVRRVLGKPLGYLCFALDMAKGAGPVLTAGMVFSLFGQTGEPLPQADMWLWMATACAAVLGHMFSPFLRFGGGKGVATGFGALLAMWPLLTLPALVALVVWCVVVRVTRYVAVASMAAAVSLPVSYVIATLARHATDRPIGESMGIFTDASPPLIVTLVLAILIVYKHRANLQRLRRGEEPRAGQRDSPL